MKARRQRLPSERSLRSWLIGGLDGVHAEAVLHHEGEELEVVGLLELDAGVGVLLNLLADEAVVGEEFGGAGVGLGCPGVGEEIALDVGGAVDVHAAADPDLEAGFGDEVPDGGAVHFSLSPRCSMPCSVKGTPVWTLIHWIQGSR